MSTHTQSFVTLLSPEEALARFRQLAAEKGWDILSEDESSAEAREGVNLKTAGEDIKVSAAPTQAGTQVHVVVSPRLGAVQVIDWGQGSAIEREVVARLSA